jgi:hypothetical protein
MNQLSNMRIKLYQTLSGVNNYFENAVNSSSDTLKQQAFAIGIIENELNKSKQQLAVLEEEKNNKIRLVEINAYYGDKYTEHSKLMKIIIFTLIPVIILAFLNSKGILPNAIFNVIISIIALIGGYFLWKTYYSIITRDNMNYQEYNWSFDPNNATTTTSQTTSTDPWVSESSYGTCVGDACCSNGLIYDSSMNQCVDPTSTSTSTESFINNQLTKMEPGNYKIQYNLKQPQAFSAII